jgi:hypothetical protein
MLNTILFKLAICLGMACLCGITDCHYGQISICSKKGERFVLLVLKYDEAAGVKQYTYILNNKLQIYRQWKKR